MKKGRIIQVILLTIVIILSYILYEQLRNGAEIIIFKYEKEKEITASQQRPYNDTLENGYINNHLYNQLSDTGKIIYTIIYDNIENLKSGDYKIEFKNIFKDILEEEDGNQKLGREYQAAIEALTYENPEIFFLDVTKMYINIGKISRLIGNSYNVYISNSFSSGELYLSEGFSNKEDIDKCQKEIEKIRDQIINETEGKKDVEKIKYIHDYLVDTIEYDTTLQKKNLYNIYGALVSKTCVCEGYAKALQYLLNSVGIENVIVNGSATNSKGITEEHAWNYVKLEEAWYAIDTTWDDPVTTGGGEIPSMFKYQYFLKGSKTMNKNHYPSKKFTKDGMEFELPELSETDYKR